MARRKRKKDKRIPVLLLQDHPYLGQQGTVVLVKPGYYRFLISQKIATIATEQQLASGLKKELLTEKVARRKEIASSLKEKIENLLLEFTLTKDKTGKTFGSITKEKILKALLKNGIKLSKGQIILEQKITEPGEYTLRVNLGYEIQATLKIKVN